MARRKSQKRDRELREFGAWFRDKRIRGGHASQKEFAGRLKITDVQLSRIENGDSGISPETLSVAINLLELDPLDAYKRAGLLPEFKVDKIEDALDVTSFFDRKGLSDEDRAAIRPFLEGVDKVIERFSKSPATPQDDDIIQTIQELERDIGGPTIKRMLSDEPMREGDPPIRKLQPLTRRKKTSR